MSTRTRLLCIVAALALALPGAVRAQAGVTTYEFETMGMELALSPDGYTLALWENGAVRRDVVEPDALPIRLFDLETGEDVGQLAGATDYVGSAAFSPDGARLATYHRNGDIYLWNVADQSAESVIRTYMPGGGLVRFFDDGQHLLLSFGQQDAWIVDIESQAVTNRVGLHFNTNEQFRSILELTTGLLRTTLFRAAPAPGGEAVAGIVGDDSIRLWDTGTGRETVLVPGVRADENPIFRFTDLDFLPDGDRLYAVSARGDNPGILMVNVESGEVEQTLPLTTGNAVYSPALSVFVVFDVVDDTGGVYLQPLNGGERKALFMLPGEASRGPTSLAVADDGSRAVLTQLEQGSTTGVQTVYVIDLLP